MVTDHHDGNGQWQLLVDGVEGRCLAKQAAVKKSSYSTEGSETIYGSHIVRKPSSYTMIEVPIRPTKVDIKCKGAGGSS